MLAPELALANGAMATGPVGAARTLGVRYVVRGSARIFPSRIRVGVELVDGITGYQIWATVFERTSHRPLALEDEIVAKVGALVDLELQRCERQPALSKSGSRLDAHDLMQRGY